MSVIALAVFLTGIVLGVFAMLYGTERQVQTAVAPHERQGEHEPATEPSPALNRATIAAFAVAFGLTAYLLDRADLGVIWLQLLAAFAAGTVAFALQALLFARWAIPGARVEHVEPRFLLQGTIGHVFRDAPAKGTGQMRYALDMREYTLPVRSMHGGAIPAGTDVVMDRVEDGIAYVELWSVVEGRL